MQRCAWAVSEITINYHDQEWGVPLHDDQKLFEFLVLEGAQAGLNWETILKKRAAYREAFDQFDPVMVADYKTEKIDQLLSNPGIIRNRLKIKSSIRNAQVYLRIQAEFGSFDQFLWNYVDGRPIQNKFHSLSEIPAQTDLSTQISMDLKTRGMNFVGPTIMYAYMQAVGLVNDHVVDCFRYNELMN